MLEEKPLGSHCNPRGQTGAVYNRKQGEVHSYFLLFAVSSEFNEQKSINPREGNDSRPQK